MFDLVSVHKRTTESFHQPSETTLVWKTLSSKCVSTWINEIDKNKGTTYYFHHYLLPSTTLDLPFRKKKYIHRIHIAHHLLPSVNYDKTTNPKTEEVKGMVNQVEPGVAITSLI